MPMSSYPALHELIWLFESEPAFKHVDLGWPISEAVFETWRGPWQVRCAVGVYDYSVEIDAFLDGTRTFHLFLNQIVDVLSVDRAQDREVLVIQPGVGHDLREVRLQLRPYFSLFVLPAEP